MVASWTHCQERFSFLEFYTADPGQEKPRRSASAPPNSGATTRDSSPCVYLQTLAERAFNADFMEPKSTSQSRDSASDSSREYRELTETSDVTTCALQAPPYVQYPQLLTQGDTVKEMPVKAKESSPLSGGQWQNQKQVQANTLASDQNWGMSANLAEIKMASCLPDVGAFVAGSAWGSTDYETGHSDPTCATSVMICNIPCRVTLPQLVEAIDGLGFANAYDFIYLPSPKHQQNVGYGFVNFLNPDDAYDFMGSYEGFRFPGRNSKKIGETKLARIQGTENYMKYLKSAPQRSYFVNAALGDFVL